MGQLHLSLSGLQNLLQIFPIYSSIPEMYIEEIFFAFLSLHFNSIKWAWRMDIAEELFMAVIYYNQRKCLLVNHTTVP